MKKNPSTTWKMFEWEYLSKLLDRGYPILDSLRILQKNDEEIEQSIMRGNDIADILFHYAKPKLRQHLLFFTSISSLSNAISCSIRMENFENEVKKKIKKECFYPVFIFLFAYVTLCIFIQFVIPQLLLSFPMETLDSFFVISIFLLKLLCFLIGMLLLGILGLFLGIKYTNFAHTCIPYFLKLQIVKEYISYSFSNYMKELDQDGLSTKKAIQYLSELPEHTFLAYFMKSVKKEVEQGKELSTIMQEHAMLTSMFQICFTIGTKTGNLAISLTDYVVFQEEKWILKIHRLSTIVQIVSYGFVGFLVILVYQIMLVPLQLLDSM